MVRGLALVSGASSGIGFELAKLFAGHGYDLVVAADEDSIEASADKLRADGLDVRAILAYEEAHKNRHGVVSAAQTRVAAIAQEVVGIG